MGQQDDGMQEPASRWSVSVRLVNSLEVKRAAHGKQATARMGSLDIDELSGIPDRKRFCLSGGVDWHKQTDRGEAGMCFWDGLHDHERNAERASRLNQLFLMKYPKLPDDVPSPECWTGLW